MDRNCKLPSLAHLVLTQAQLDRLKSESRTLPKLDSMILNPSFPPSFDLRSQNRVTPLKYPECASCWSTGAIASLESSLLPFESWDFSEDQLQCGHGADCGDGGTCFAAASILTAWHAPVRESDYDYNLPTEQGPIVKHVQRIFFPPHKSVPLLHNLLKYLITYVGAIDASVSLSGYNDDPQYYYDPHWSIVHDVILIGWDDNIPRTKFVYTNGDYTALPAGDGAFLVKGWDYYYISYYDGTIQNTLFAAFTAEPSDNYNRVVRLSNHGYDSTGSFVAGTANVFRAPSDDNLSAIGFFSELPDPESVSDLVSNYRIEIHLSPTDGPLNSAGPTLFFYVSFPLAGYYTVDLPQKVRLHAGQKFSVVITAAESDETFELHFNNLPPEDEGTSWTLPGADMSWQEYDPQCHLAIQAYTTQVDGLISHVGFSTTPDRRLAITLSNEEATSISLRVLVRYGENVDARDSDDVPIEYYLNQYGETIRARNGRVRLSAGETITIFSAASKGKDSVPLTCAIYHIQARKQVLLSSAVIHSNLSLKPLQLISISSGSSSITVKFDQEIKRGPGLWKISITSPREVKFAVPWIDGQTLTLRTTGVFASEYSAGLLWTVRIPRRAVLGSAGSCLDHDFAWSFTPNQP